MAECAVSRELFSPGYQGKIQGIQAFPRPVYMPVGI